jgi:hypothetical protein
LNDISIHNLTSTGGPPQKDMVTDLAPSAYGPRRTVPLEPSSRNQSSFTDLEAAGILLALPQGDARSAATILPRSASEATPKASQPKKTNLGPSKSHKRSHSKVNDALHQEVRKQLQAATTAVETVEIYEDLEYPGKSGINLLIQKEKQLPLRSWADVRVPILQGEDCTKRYCAAEDKTATDRAAMYLRRRLESEAATACAAAFTASDLVIASRDHCVSTSCR